MDLLGALRPALPLSRLLRLSGWALAAAAVEPILPMIWMNVAAGAMIAALVLTLFGVLARQAQGREQMAQGLRQAKLDAERDRQIAISETKNRSQFWSSLGTSCARR
jgi:hypothetical protein